MTNPDKKPKEELEPPYDDLCQDCNEHLISPQRLCDYHKTKRKFLGTPKPAESQCEHVYKLYCSNCGQNPKGEPLSGEKQADNLFEIVYDWLNEFFGDIQPWDEDTDIRGTAAEVVLKHRFEEALKSKGQ